MFDEIMNKLTQFEDVNVRDCGGVYDKIIRIKYGKDPHDLGWIYMKNNIIKLMHIKDDNFDTLDSFISRLQELKN
jgi:hypothetical protein